MFTDRAFAGNPLAVVLDADDLSTAAMQALASEFALSETAFPLRAATTAPTTGCGSSRRPSSCPSPATRRSGRPGCCTGWGGSPAGERVQSCGAGLLPVRVGDGEVVLTGGDAVVRAGARPRAAARRGGAGPGRPGRARRGAPAAARLHRTCRCARRPWRAPSPDAPALRALPLGTGLSVDRVRGRRERAQPGVRPRGRRRRGPGDRLGRGRARGVPRGRGRRSGTASTRTSCARAPSWAGRRRCGARCGWRAGRPSRRRWRGPSCRSRGERCAARSS